MKNANHEYLHVSRWMHYYFCKDIECNIVYFSNKSEIDKSFFDKVREKEYDICLENLIIEEMVFLEDTMNK